MGSLITELASILEEATSTILGDPLFASIFKGTASRETYLAYLSETYHYIKQTPVTLRLGAETLARLDHPVYRAIRQKFIDHEKEESGHDDWVLSDIRALGGDAEAVQRSAPNPAVAAYIAEARFVATSRHPVAIFGEAFVLEGLAQRLGLEGSHNLRTRSGIPGIEHAVSFMHGHGELDQGHTVELEEVLALITDPEDQRHILRRARNVAYQYTHMLHYLGSSTTR
jgi:pyrroloquinoline quinone (PQQ) biosynthesis protein C